MPTDVYSQKVLKVENLPEYALANMWSFQLPPVINLKSGVSYPSSGVQTFDLHVVSSSIPLRKLEMEKTNFNLIIPKGRAQYSTFTMVFRETIDFQVSTYFEAWLDNIYDFDLQVYRKGFINQKQDARLQFIRIRSNPLNQILTLLSPIQQLNILQSGWSVDSISNYDFVNIMPLGFSDIEVENESGDPLQISVEFEVEKVIPSHATTNIASGNLFSG